MNLKSELIYIQLIYINHYILDEVHKDLNLFFKYKTIIFIKIYNTLKYIMSYKDQ